MGLTISIINLSSVAWGRNNWKVGAGKTDEVNWTDEVTQVPAENLQPHDGAAQAAASTEHLSWFVQDALWMTLGYGSAEGNFAVTLLQRFHMFGIGPQAEWQVWEGSTWSPATTAAAPYAWTFARTTVKAVPTLSDSAGSVNIIITNRAGSGG